jgi:hypothetical protein
MLTREGTHAGPLDLLWRCIASRGIDVAAGTPCAHTTCGLEHIFQRNATAQRLPLSTSLRACNDACWCRRFRAPASASDWGQPCETSPTVAVQVSSGVEDERCAGRCRCRSWQCAHAPPLVSQAWYQCRNAVHTATNHWPEGMQARPLPWHAQRPSSGLQADKATRNC